MDKHNVSFFKPELNKPTVKSKFSVETSLLEILSDIKSGRYKENIEWLRTLEKKDYDKQKIFLPAFTPSGTFKERNAKSLLQHSGLISIDFDKLENTKAIFNEIICEKWVFSAFISPSNSGIKVLIPIDSAKHLESFLAIENYFQKCLNLQIDKQCKDVSRLCFISYDSNLFLNESAIQFSLHSNTNFFYSSLDKVIEKQPETKDESLNYKIEDSLEILKDIEIVTQRIEESNKDITEKYEDWLKLGFSLAFCLKENGRLFFHRISKLNSKYDFTTTEKQYTECLKQRQNGIKKETFFYLAKQHGINIVTKEQTEFIKSNERNKEKIISDRVRIENTISEYYELRFNTILNRVECIEKEKESSNWEEANEHDISRTIEIQAFRSCSPNRIKSILLSNFVKKFNPFTNYFESLPSYSKQNEPDYIENLCSIVQLKDEYADRERFNRHFKKALVRCVACSISENKNNLNYNKHAIIFISPKQSIGKSGFIRFLVPKSLELYFTEKMTFGNREEDFTMQSSFIINLDEMAQIDEKNLASVKSAMSKGNLNFRDMNTSKRINVPRRCNFFGNTNETQILKDDSGSVRWLCFEVDGFNKELRYWEPSSSLYVDINNVWAQAFYLYKNGFDFQLTNKELMENEKINSQYKENSLEEELILNYLAPAPKEKDNHKQVFQIMSMLGNRAPMYANKLNPNKVGSILRSKGFIYGQEFSKEKGYQIKGYYLKEIK